MIGIFKLLLLCIWIFAKAIPSMVVVQQSEDFIGTVDHHQEEAIEIMDTDANLITSRTGPLTMFLGCQPPRSPQFRLIDVDASNHTAEIILPPPERRS